MSRSARSCASPSATRSSTASSSASPRPRSVPDEKLVAPTAVREDSIPRDLVDLALWMADEYCSTPARALALVTPPPGKAQDGVLGRGRPAPKAASTTTSARCSSACPGPAGDDLAALRRLEKRGLVAIAQRVAPPRAAHEPVRRIAPSSSRPPRPTRWRRSRPRPARPTCCTASPARARPRSTCARRRAALERGRGRDRARAGDRADAADRRALRARFGDTVALLHSALSEGERYDEWRRLRTGEARIAVGPRSAVFAPVANLGLVVVDEEHDASYKHESDPRYDARHVAAYRAYQAGARLLAGSATPRPGDACTRCARLRLPTRVGGRPRPAAGAGARHARRAALAAPRDAAGAGRLAQVDRAAQPARLVELPHLPLVREGVGVPELRRRARPAPRRGRARLPPLRPPRARSRRAATPAARSRSPATARAPSASRPSCSARSTSRSSGSTPTPRPTRTPSPSCWRASPPRPTGLLLGTQMVAKGHDFPDVTLGVVLDADSTLRFPDFRAEERTFALIAQLAGPAGRGPRGGRVLVQTTSPGRAVDRRRRPPRRRRLPQGELERRRGAALPAVRRPDPGRHQRRGRPRPRAPPRPGSPRRSTCRTPSCSARRRCSACATASASSSCSRPPPAPRRSHADRRRRRGRRPRQTLPRRQLLRRRRPDLKTIKGSDPFRISARWRTRFIRRRTARSPSRTSGSIPRRGRGARRRCSSCASTAIRCCASRALEIERFDDALRRGGAPDGAPHARRATGSGSPRRRSA